MTNKSALRALVRAQLAAASRAEHGDRALTTEQLLALALGEAPPAARPPMRSASPSRASRDCTSSPARVASRKAA